MKKTILYSLVILVILVIVVLGWYAFSTQAAYLTRWKCTDTKTYTCPSGTTNYTCANGVLSCLTCTNYVTRYYNVTLLDVASTINQSTNATILVGIFTISEEPASLSVGQKKALSDSTMFGVTYLTLNYSEFYLQSTIETKSSSILKYQSIIIPLKAPLGASCGVNWYSCSEWYVPSCASSNTLKCTKTSYLCSSYQPSGDCIAVGVCGGSCTRPPCPV